jgi:hypothetical protein
MKGKQVDGRAYRLRLFTVWSISSDVVIDFELNSYARWAEIMFTISEIASTLDCSMKPARIVPN